MTKFYGLLGLCARAGKIVSGEKNVETLVKQGGAEMVLVDGGISETGMKSVTDACRYVGITWFVTGPGELGPAIGKPGRMTAAVTEKGFAQRLAVLARDTQSDAGVHEGNG